MPHLVTLTAAVITLLTGSSAHAANYNIRSGYSQNMYETDSQNSQQITDNTLVISQQLNETTRGIFVLSAVKDIKNNEENFQLTDSILQVQRKVFENEIQKISLGGGIILPTSKDSQLRQQLNFGTRLEVTDSLSFTNLAAWSFSGSLKMTQMNHRYETAIDGSQNTATHLRQGISVDYQINKFSVGANFDHINTWKYSGKMSDSFEASQEVSLIINKTFSTYLGHTNSGSVLKDNGTDSNIQIFNDNQSLVFIGLNVSL